MYLMVVFVIIIFLFTIVIQPLIRPNFMYFLNSTCESAVHSTERYARNYMKYFLFFLIFNSINCNLLSAQNQLQPQIHWFDTAYLKASFHRMINYSVRDSSIIRTTLVTGPQDSIIFLDQRGIVISTNGLVVDQLDTVNNTVQLIHNFITQDNFKISRTVFSPNGEFRLSTISVRKDSKGFKLTVFHYDSIISEIDLSYSKGFFNSYNELIANDGSVRLMLLPTMSCTLTVANKDPILISPDRATYLHIFSSGTIIKSDISVRKNQSVVNIWHSSTAGVRVLLIDKDTAFTYSPELSLHKRKYELLRVDNDRDVLWRIGFESAGSVLVEGGTLDHKGRCVIMFNVGSYFEQGVLRINETPEFISQLSEPYEIIVCIDDKGYFKWSHKMGIEEKRFILGKMLVDSVGDRLLVACGIVDSSDMVLNPFSPGLIKEAGEYAGVGVVSFDLESGDLKWWMLERNCSINAIVCFNVARSGTYFFAAVFQKLPAKQQQFPKVGRSYSKILAGTFNLK